MLYQRSCDQDGRVIVMGGEMFRLGICEIQLLNNDTHLQENMLKPVFCSVCQNGYLKRLSKHLFLDFFQCLKLI